MRILVSDKISDKAVEILKSSGFDVTYDPEITPEALLSAISGYSALIVRSRTKVTPEIIDAGKNLKIIGRVGTGIDNIDKKTASQKNIIIVNAPDANSIAVAELTIGLMLSMLRKLYKADESMRKGDWIKKELTGFELNGKTVGIVGYGHIGKRVESLVQAFGAKTLVYSRHYKTAELNDLFSKCDLITLHVGLNDETRGMIGKSLLEAMKPTAYVFNLSRALVVDLDAFYEVLSQKKIAGAALDVFDVEPLPPDSKWRKLPNVFLTPHIGASTKEAVTRASRVVAEDVIKFLQTGKAENKVI
jgi:D-3-phosphoglycerate dehydrogenase